MRNSRRVKIRFRVFYTESIDVCSNQSSFFSNDNSVNWHVFSPWQVHRYSSAFLSAPPSLNSVPFFCSTSLRAYFFCFPFYFSSHFLVPANTIDSVINGHTHKRSVTNIRTFFFSRNTRLERYTTAKDSLEPYNLVLLLFTLDGIENYWCDN